MSVALNREAADLHLLTGAEMARKLERGETTSAALVEACLTRIAESEPTLHAWAHVDPALALAQARARDAEPRRSALHGVPIGIKDILDTYDMPTSYGSSVYRSYRPHSDTGVVALLRAAGLVILGKCATTEFASPVPAGVGNPRDLRRSPGVSSSGSAAAVADHMTPLSVGSQTGGSTILPAAFCGVVGFKGSLTGIDRGGIRHFRPSLDTIGLFSRHIDDIALLNEVLTGDAPAAVPRAVDLRVGICRTFNWHHAQPETAEALESAAKSLAAAGVRVVDSELPPVFADIEKSFQVISGVEGARSMADEMREHLATMNAWLQEAARVAATLDQAQYDRAQVHAVACRRALRTLFDEYDVLVTPSACGEAASDLTAVSNSAFNRFWTLMHGPCVNIPAYSGPHGLPVGIQIVGPAGSDGRTIAASKRIAEILMP
jgi:amidase